MLKKHYASIRSISKVLIARISKYTAEIPIRDVLQSRGPLKFRRYVNYVDCRNDQVIKETLVSYPKYWIIGKYLQV